MEHYHRDCPPRTSYTSYVLGQVLAETLLGWEVFARDRSPRKNRTAESKAMSEIKPKTQGIARLLIHFWRYIRPERRKCWIILALMALTLIFELGRPLLLKAGLDHIAAGDAYGLRQIAIVFLALLLLDYVCRSQFGYFFGTVMLGSLNRLRDAIFHHALRLKMAYYDHHPVGALLTRTVNDVEALRETLHAGVATILVDILTVIGIFGVMLSLDFYLSLAMVPTGIVVWALTRWFGMKLRRQYLAVRTSLARSNAYMAEGIAGVEIIQAFNCHEASCRQFGETNHEYCHAGIWRSVYEFGLSAVVDGLVSLLTALVLYLGFNVRFGLVEVSAMIVYLHLLDRIFVPIRDLTGKFAVIQQALAALERIFDLLFTPEYIPRGTKMVGCDRLHIEFDRVNFSYQEGTPVLREVSFAVEPGQTVALVGATGSGKSTVCRLLLRVYDGYTGRIRVNGTDLTELDYHSLHLKIAVIHQDPYLFPGTIRDNITMFRDEVPDAHLKEIVRLVKADDMIASLPGGMCAEVKENGANLSAGQLQLIAFARALTHDTPAIVMDEATANVDSVTEAWVKEALRRIFAGKTAIIVAHRLSTIAAADVILVMKQGRIVQRGNHEALMRENDGYYANLVRSSQKGLLP